MPDSTISSNAWSNPVSAVVAPEQQTSSPITQELQPPQAAPAPRPLQLEPSTPPITATSANKNTHSFIARAASGLLDAIVGTPGPNYGYDANGKLISQAAPPMTTGQKLQRLLANATEGLAAGSRVPPQKSAAAAIAAGLGAGAGAINERDQAQDLLKRKEASDEFEKEQASILHRAQVGQTLALTARNWAEAQKLGLDLDPQRQAGMAIYKAAQDANVPGAELIPVSEWMTRVQNNPKLQTEFHHFPAGFGAPEIDEATGTVKPGAGMIAILPAHGDSADGKIELPAAYIDQIGKFVSLSGRFSKNDVAQIQAGHEVSLQQLAAIDNAVEEGRNNWLKGEHSPTLDWKNDAKGNPTVPVLSNSITGEPVQYLKPGVTPGAAVEGVEKRKGEEAKINLETEQAKEAQAKSKQALAEAELAARTIGIGNGSIPSGDALKNLMSAYNNLPATAKGFLQNVTPDMQATILSTWAGRTDPKGLPTSVRKGTGQLSRQQIESMITRFDPTWRENKYETVKKLEDDYTTGKDGASIRSINQFLQHADQAAQTAKSYQTTRSALLNKPINWLRQNFAGDPQVTKLVTDLTAPRSEWETIIKSGHVPTSDEVKAGQVLVSEDSSPAAILTALGSMSHQALARMGELDETYKRVTGVGYPDILSQRARDAANRLGLVSEVSPFNTGGSVFGGASPVTQSGSQNGQNPNTPAPNTHIFDAKAWQQAHPGQDVNAAISYAKSQGFEVRQ